MIDIVTIAWGKETLENYFNICLISLSSKKNSELISKYKITINLICDFQDISLIADYKEHISQNKINLIYEKDYNDSLQTKYSKHTNYFVKNLNKFKNQYLIPLYPDAIVSYFFLETLIEYILKKKEIDIFYLPGPKINSIALKNLDFDKKKWNSEKNLSELILKYLHSKMDYMTLNNNFFNNSPAWLLIKFKSFIIFNCFHMTPLCFKKNVIKESLSNHSLDVYLSQIALNFKVYVFDNSNRIVWISYENDPGHLSEFFKIKNFQESLNWIKAETNLSQRKIGINSYIVSKTNLNKLTKFFLKFIISYLIKIIFKFAQYRKIL